jgi:hypothetical protein
MINLLSVLVILICLQLPNLLEDDRFADMFKDSAFQVDTSADEYKLLNPLVAKLEKNRKKKEMQQEAIDAQFEEIKVFQSISQPINQSIIFRLGRRVRMMMKKMMPKAKSAQMMIKNWPRK